MGDDQVSPRPCPQGAGQMPVPDALSQWATIGRKRADAFLDGVSAEQAMRPADRQWEPIFMERRLAEIDAAHGNRIRLLADLFRVMRLRRHNREPFYSLEVAVAADENSA